MTQRGLRKLGIQLEKVRGRGLVPAVRGARPASTGRVHHLRLKGNVIVGRLIPDGTGMRVYREIYLAEVASKFFWEGGWGNAPARHSYQ